MPDAAGSGGPARTAAHIHGSLMQAVREGRYAPGGRLPNERQLAAHFGASRQRIRDVLLILEDAGLVERKVGSGTWLAVNAPQIIERLDADVDLHARHEHSFIETIEARLVLEPGVAALAARNITQAGRADLEEALEAVRRPASWFDYKLRIYLFARAYYAASGNAFLLWTFDQILKARRAHRFDGHRDEGAVAEIVRRHAHAQLAEICAAIAAGDEARAEAVTRTYLIGIAASSGLT
jgi:DNA-binding FadR family transcriptional regulator